MVSVRSMVVPRRDETPSERAPRSGKRGTSRPKEGNARCCIRLCADASRGIHERGNAALRTERRRVTSHASARAWTRHRRLADAFSRTMRVTVCQLHDEPDAFAADWSALCAHARRERSELVLLPEMTFGRWFAVTRLFEERPWREALRAYHQRVG